MGRWVPLAATERPSNHYYGTPDTDSFVPPQGQGSYQVPTTKNLKVVFMAQWVVGVANSSPHFALREGDIPVQIHNTVGPFDRIEDICHVFSLYPYRLVPITVARGNSIFVETFVTPDESGRLTGLEWGLFSGPNAEPLAPRVLTPGPACVMGHPSSDSVLVVGITAMQRSFENFQIGDILLRVHTTQGPFQSVEAVVNLIRPFKWRLLEVEVQRAGRHVVVEATPCTGGMFHGVQLGLMQASPLQMGAGGVAPTETQRAQLEMWLRGIGLRAPYLYQCVQRLIVAGITLETLPLLTPDDIGRLGISQDDLRRTVLQGIEGLRDNNNAATLAVGVPAVLQVTRALAPVGAH